MKMTLPFVALGLAVFCGLAQAQTDPKIEFEQTVYDFGKTSGAETVSGKFKFSNKGAGVLTLQQPKAQCGCTTPSLAKNSYQAGETGEVNFSINLGKSKAVIQKTITVTSNDPKTPDVVLTIKADYSPLYEISPPSLYAIVSFDGTYTNVVNLTRTDGKPLDIRKVEASKPWIVAKLEPGAVPGPASARVMVELKNDGVARPLQESINIYAGDSTNTPLASIPIYGQLQGELTISQQRLMWTFNDPVAAKAQASDALFTRTVSVKSATGKQFEIKNVKSTVQGLVVEAKKQEDGKGYDLVAKVRDIPASTMVGEITFETSTKSQPTVQVPLTISIFKPQPPTAVRQVQSPGIVPAASIPQPPPLLARPPGQ